MIVNEFWVFSTTDFTRPYPQSTKLPQPESCAEHTDFNKLLLSSDGEINQLITGGLRNELCKRGLNENKTNKKEIHDTIWKSVEDKVPNFTDEDMDIKSLTGFLHT